MTPELKQKISKIYELVKRGTDGEQAAAKKALDNILAKHDLEGIDLESLDKLEYRYNYSTELEIWLFLRLIATMVDYEVQMIKHQYKPKHIRAYLTYMDSITITCAYEYFRRHMKQQWELFCAPELAKKRKPKTKNKRREELKEIFFDKYVIASKLYKESEIRKVEIKDMSKQEQKDRYAMLDVEGGQYSKQVTNGLYLD